MNRNEGQAMQLGLTLDIARKYYPASNIVRLIDALGKFGFAFLQLHVSDDENYGIESVLLGQTEGCADVRDGVCYNRETGKPFLSNSQLAYILSYARSSHVEVVPEVDSPAHMGGIWDLLGESGSSELRVRSSGELNMSDPRAALFMQALCSEVVSVFSCVGALSHFHIGCDEFGGAESPGYRDFVPYANAMIGWLNRRGITARLWNDGFCRHTVSQIHGDFEVCYWNFTENGRCSMGELTGAGIRVFNCNRYYLYFLPGKNGDSAEVLDRDIAYAASDIEGVWDFGVWDANRLDTAIPVSREVVGASLAIWGECASGVDSRAIVEQTTRLIEALSNRRRHRASGE